jgi:hypothetical protein
MAGSEQKFVVATLAAIGLSMNVHHPDSSLSRSGAPRARALVPRVADGAWAIMAIAYAMWLWLGLAGGGGEEDQILVMASV